jgi:hypothetical protein
MYDAIRTINDPRQLHDTREELKKRIVAYTYRLHNYSWA